jgi:uncharacterized membrane protein YkvA (DUF1232 family)
MAKILEMDIRSREAKPKQLKNEIYALYLASKHPRTPWYAKIFALLLVGYALSPIDLIPDFMPVIGYIDDMIIVPAGIFLLIKIIPKEILEECREKARSRSIGIKRGKWVAAMIIILIDLAICRFHHFETPAVDLQIKSRGSACLFLGQINASGVLQGKDNLFPQGFNIECGLIKKFD